MPKYTHIHINVLIAFITASSENVLLRFSLSSKHSAIFFTPYVGSPKEAIITKYDTIFCADATLPTPTGNSTRDTYAIVTKGNNAFKLL